MNDSEQEYTATQNQLQFFAFWKEQHDTGEDAWNQADHHLQEALRAISGQEDLRNEKDLVRQIEDVSGKGLLEPCQKSLEPVLQASIPWWCFHSQSCSSSSSIYYFTREVQTD